MLTLIKKISLVLILVSCGQVEDISEVKKFFNHEFYRTKYSTRLNGSDPLQHFMNIDFSEDFQKHTDPNDWFNTTLYLRCFPCSENPFVNFLKQPVSTFDKTLPAIHVYAQNSQLTRAWIAIESLLRMNKHSIILHLQENVDYGDMFKHHVKRGLIIKKDNTKNKSFYKSNFFMMDLEPEKYKDYFQPKQFWLLPSYLLSKGPNVLRHNVNRYSPWGRIGKIDPLCINIAEAAEEPLLYTIDQISDLTSFLDRISSGIDICFYYHKLHKNWVLTPGFLDSWIQTKHLNPTKEFSISFLLSMHQKGEDHEQEGFQYSQRKLIWDSESLIGKPTRFYVSKRSISKFPKKYHSRVLPTDSKKWVFNSQFHIAMENTRQKNYMTEKLLGCFTSLTIPIYLGCPNVRDYFDERGMFIAESAEEIIAIAQSINKDTYKKMLPYLQENKRRALKLIKLRETSIAEFLKREFK